jgi:hypothetical protein
MIYLALFDRPYDSSAVYISIDDDDRTARLTTRVKDAVVYCDSGISGVKYYRKIFNTKEKFYDLERQYMCTIIKMTEQEYEALKVITEL